MFMFGSQNFRLTTVLLLFAGTTIFASLLFCLPSNCDYSANELKVTDTKEAIGLQTSSLSAKLALETRLKRAASKGRVRAKSAQISRTTSSSTTTTTTTTTTTESTITKESSSSGEKEQKSNEESDYSGSDEYESIESPESKTTPATKTSSNTKNASKVGNAESPQEEQDDGEQDEDENLDATTTTTTTTRASIAKPSKLKSQPQQPGGGKSKQQPLGGKNKQGKSSTSSSSEQESKVETSGSESEESDDGEDGDGDTSGSNGDSDSEESEEVLEKPKSNRKDSNQTEAKAATTSASKSAAAAAVVPARIKPKKKPLVRLPTFLIKPKNESACTPEAYLEFPRDFIGDKWRIRGLVLIHVAVVCYMFYSLALVCERYFMPSLEEFSQRLGLSEDVAGATLMSAGSSAPELFTAILGVFVAKGDVGTGAIVGSAVFNILFVIGLCAFVTTSTAQLNWWPVLRDSVFYTFTVLVLIVFIYDERVTALESFIMIALYGVYIMIMVHNEALKQQVTLMLQSNPVTAALLKSAVSMDGPDDVFGGIGGSTSSAGGAKQYATTCLDGKPAKQTDIGDDSMFLAAQLVVVRHKRLFRSTLRFQSAARYIIVKRQHRRMQNLLAKSVGSNEVNYFGPESEPLRPGSGGNSGKQFAANQRDRMEAYARTATASKSKFSIVSKEDYEFWNRPPEEHENYYIWMAKIPVNYVLHYTIPDCTLYPDKYLFTFFISIIWTAIFSYIMVWMVTLIGYTFGIPDSVMGVTFLAAGTSVPDCYSSIHAARNGMADMAVSNSIGSNVFDILIGLSLPWFIQTAIYPGVVATINSRGVIYSVILLFLSLIVTIYLMNKYEWTLKPRLGLALLIAYGLFIILTCMLEFNLFGHLNPPPCPVFGDS